MARRSASPAPALEAVPADLRGRLASEPHPAWVDPMRATLTERRFSDPDWLFEPKLDGYRCLVYRNNDDVRMLSRNQLSLKASYPAIEAHMRDQPSTDFVIDGEIIAMDGDRPSFAVLQQAQRTTVPVFYYVFDVIHLDGSSTRALPVRLRKAILREAIRFNDQVRLTPHREEDGEGLYREMCERGWEGVIAKRAESPYVSRRSGDWLKFKCSLRQELVIGGFTDPQNSRVGFGALLMGYYDRSGLLVYAGKVGTGYSNELLVELGDRLRRLEQRTSPFVKGDPVMRGSHWVTPMLVGEVEFSEWTTDGKLRHPRFLGLRTDKAASAVTRELPTELA